MRVSRRLPTAVFLVACLVATMLAIAASPATAQANSRTFPLQHVADNTDTKWELRAIVKPLGGCNPSNFLHHSFWLNESDVDAVRLSFDCVYVISFESRRQNNRDAICQVEWAWGATGSVPTDAAFSTNELRITSASDVGGGSLSNDRLYARRAGGNSPTCAIVQTSRFRINAADVVVALPKNSMDQGLTDRALRAAAITNFAVLVEPDYETSSEIPAGCTPAQTIQVRGDGKDKTLSMAGATPGATPCTYRAKVTGAPVPFEIASATEITFSAGTTVNLSTKVRLPLARIAIIQNVSGSRDQGTVGYSIDRSCATVEALPPEIPSSGGIYTLPSGTMVQLREGRYTVHYPVTPFFGPGYTYKAVATSASSNVVAGCSVTVNIKHVPANCTVRNPAQTITWSSSNKVDSFDFEFVLTCSPAAATTTTTASVATTTTVPATATTAVPPGISAPDSLMSTVDEPPSSNVPAPTGNKPAGTSSSINTPVGPPPESPTG